MLPRWKYRDRLPSCSEPWGHYDKDVQPLISRKICSNWFSENLAHRAPTEQGCFTCWLLVIAGDFWRAWSAACWKTSFKTLGRTSCMVKQIPTRRSEERLMNLESRQMWRSCVYYLLLRKRIKGWLTKRVTGRSHKKLLRTVGSRIFVLLRFRSKTVPRGWAQDRELCELLTLHDVMQRACNLEPGEPGGLQTSVAIGRTQPRNSKQDPSEHLLWRVPP